MNKFLFHECLSLFCFLMQSHVKGRVLVALADGTLAIFHRGVGKSTLNSFNCKHEGNFHSFLSKTIYNQHEMLHE